MLRSVRSQTILKAMSKTSLLNTGACRWNAQHSAFSTIQRQSTPLILQLGAEDIVEGRKFLVLSLKGYGKFGANFFKALGVNPPEPKEKAGRASKAKSKAEISL